MLSLKQQYMTYIDDMSDSELENYDMNSCQTSIVEEVGGMFRHTVSDQQVISECSRLNNELTARRTARLTASNKKKSVRGRLAALLMTPPPRPNAIKQRLSLSSARATHAPMTHAISSESLCELFNESQQPHNTSLAWEYEIGDSVLGTLTSQIPRLPNLEEEEVQPTTELNEEGKTVDQLGLLSDSSCIIAPSQPSAGGKRRIK